MVSVTAASVQSTWDRIRPELRVTPLLQASHSIEKSGFGCNLFFKLELHQLTGSFKIRGVTSKIMAAKPALLQNGIIAASGGNHGRAVAYAGHVRKLKTTVILPNTTPQIKIDLIKSWNAEVCIEGHNLDESTAIAAEIARREGLLFIHPYADEDVINGQGSLGMELLEQLPDVDTVIMAVGGGGMIAGVGTYLKAMRPNIRIIGVEPEGCPTLHDSLIAGEIVPVKNITTKIGTLAIRQTSPLNFELAKLCVDQMVLVSDEKMLETSKRLWRDFGIAGECSGVASVAGLLSGQLSVHKEEKVCAMVCGLGSDGII